MLRVKKGVTGDLLLIRLETRLDNVVYRLGFGASRAQSRQLVNHGLIAVNGRKVSIPSYEVKVGQTISIKAGKEQKNYFKNIDQALKNKQDFPSWMIFDSAKIEGKIVSLPTREEIGTNVDAQVVVEYYSR